MVPGIGTEKMINGDLSHLHDEKLSELLEHVVTLVSELFGALPPQLVQFLPTLDHTNTSPQQ